MRHTEQPLENTRNVGERTVGMERKVRQDREKQQESPETRIGNRISISTKNAMVKCKDYGAIDGKQCHITAEAHVVTSPFTVQKKVIEGDDTSNGQGYISDNEMTMETDGSTKGSVMQQKSSPPTPNHLPEMSSESEWEEMAQFPAEAHVTSPFTAQKKVIEDDDTSKAQGYISDDEMTMETDGSTKGSVLKQKSSLPSPNHLPEMSSESEWEEMVQFPAEAHVVTFPFTAKKKVIEGDDTSKGQGYNSDDEMTTETDGSTKGSVLKQKSSLPSPNHLPEMSSESEWEEMAHFPAEEHVTSPFTAQKKVIEGDDTSKGQGYISDDEMTMETDGSTKGSVLKQKSSLPSPHHLPEMSSEWEETAQFPVSRKNPKNYTCSGSVSTCGRVASAGCEKNMGPEYVTKINEELSLSPGTFTLKDDERKKRKRTLNVEKTSTRECKIRQVERKKKSSISKTTVETIEGITYESGILSQRANSPVDELETIPPPPPQLVQEPLPPDNYSRVYFDLETTGLGPSSEILQLAAICGDQHFSCYVLPTSSIQEQASRITGLTFDGSTLFKRDVPLPAVSLHECLTSFHKWLTAIQKPVLFAHNCRKFDSIILCNAITKSNFYLLSEYISGFCDTLPMLKENISMKTTSFSLETLVRNVLGYTYDAHDAVEDCKYLKKLVEHSSICIDAYYLNYTFTVSYIMSIMRQMETKKSNKQSLVPLITGKVVSKSMLNKISSSGLSMHHLHLAYQRKGFDGIYTLFTTCFQGKVRVTKQKNIITNVANFLQER